MSQKYRPVLVRLTPTHVLILDEEAKPLTVNASWSKLP